jgi:N-methylhydantoinase B
VADHCASADGTREELPSKKMIVLHPGDQLWEYIAGGAGYGDPLDRDPGLVLADVLDGKVSRESAREIYGVMFATDSGVDEVGTKELREAARRRRGAIEWTFDRGVDGRQA